MKWTGKEQAHGLNVSHQVSVARPRRNIWKYITLTWIAIIIAIPLASYSVGVRCGADFPPNNVVVVCGRVPRR